MIKHCITCNKKFSIINNRPLNKVYCSAKCRAYHYNNVKYAKHRRAKARWRVNNKYTRKCDVCNKEYTGAGFKYCSKECLAEDYKKRYALDKNPAWEGGLSFLPYPITFNSALKESTKQRDGYKCQICGVSQVECLQPMCIHHIDYDKQNCNISNLVTVCKICHLKTNSKRNYWKEYFMKKEVCHR